MQHLVKSFELVNCQQNKSNVVFYDPEQITNKSCIVSDANEEILIRISFENTINLNSIKLFAYPLANIELKTNNIADEEQEAAPKRVHVYKVNKFNVSLNDITTLTPDVSITCSQSKLQNGEYINLKRTSKNSTKFGSVEFCAVYIESNQNNTYKTYLNGITFHGEIENNITEEKQNDQKDDHDQEHTFDRTDTKKNQALSDIISKFRSKDMLGRIDSSYLFKPSNLKNQILMPKPPKTKNISYTSKKLVGSKTLFDTRINAMDLTTKDHFEVGDEFGYLCDDGILIRAEVVLSHSKLQNKLFCKLDENFKHVSNKTSIWMEFPSKRICSMTKLNELKLANNTSNNIRNDIQHTDKSPDTTRNCLLSKCKCLNRILDVLQRYQLYINNNYNPNDPLNEVDMKNDSKSNTNNNNIYGDNYNNSTLLNDYNHLLYFHSSQFEEIYRLLTTS
eukprot:165164_1